MGERTADVVHDGFGVPESLRWHDAALWFADLVRDGCVYMVSGGSPQPVCSVAARPGGIGWLPDGRMLVVSMEDRRVLRLEPDGRLVEHADLADLATGDLNDMVVDPQGRAYVGNFGFDYHAVAKTTAGAMMYAPPGPPHATLAVLDPDGSLIGRAPGLLFPNGCALLDEGRLLVVAETLAMRLTAFTIDSVGLPSSPRPWAPLIADGLWEALRDDGLRGRLVRRISSLLDRHWIAERSASPIAPDGIACIATVARSGLRTPCAASAFGSARVARSSSAFAPAGRPSPA